MHLVASDHRDDFVYSGRVARLLLSTWRAVKGAGIAVATAAANIDLNLESLEGEASANHFLKMTPDCCKTFLLNLTVSNY